MRWGLLVWGCVCALVAPAAHASPRQESLVQDDDQLLYGGPQVADRTVAQLRELGTDRVRVTLHWRNVAPDRRPANPADPRAYDPGEFDAVDHLLRSVRPNGIRVLLTVTGPAPDWAVRRPADPGGKAVWRPRAKEYRRFVRMLGTRYSGEYADENQDRAVLPRVSAWSVWNEPNWHSQLLPQWRRGRPFAGRAYRALHRAASAGLVDSGHFGDEILLGETAPLGSTLRRARSNLKAVLFLRQLFCLRRDLRPMGPRAARANRCDYDRRGPLLATAYAHHPYTIMGPPGRRGEDPLGITLPDAGRLARILDAAAAAGRIRPGMPIWFTEFGWQTAPPDPFRGIPLERHARWLARAERLTARNPRIAVHAQFLLRDDEPKPGTPAGSGSYWGTWQSGLQFADGRAKPALDAYRLPLVAPARVRAGQPLRLWGMVRPAAPDDVSGVVVQRRAGRGAEWEAVRELAVADPRGYFETELPAPAGDAEYRFVWVPPAPEPEPLLPLLRPATAAPPPPVASPPVRVRVE